MILNNISIKRYSVHWGRSTICNWRWVCLIHLPVSTHMPWGIICSRLLIGCIRSYSKILTITLLLSKLLGFIWIWKIYYSHIWERLCHKCLISFLLRIRRLAIIWLNFSCWCLNIVHRWYNLYHKSSTVFVCYWRRVTIGILVVNLV